VQQGLVDAGQIGDPLVLGQFEHDAIGGQPQFTEQGAGVAVHQAAVEQAGWRDVEKQSAGQALGGKGAQAGLAAGMLQVESAAAARGGGEELIRAMQRAVFRPADQRFIAQDGAHTKIQDGLEDREQQAFRQDALEFHCLFVNSHNRFNRKKPVIQFRRR